MFDISKSTMIIERSINRYYAQARIELNEEFNSDGYNHILKSFFVDANFKMAFEFQDDIDIGNQDFLELFAQGGQIKKGDDFIPVRPSHVIRKYLGKR